MKKLCAVLSIALLAVFSGCGKRDSGAPEMRLPAETIGPFSISMSTKLNRGKSETMSIGLRRGAEFSGDVALEIGNLPEGVASDPATPVIKQGELMTKIILTAAADAALGDFNLKLTAHPAKGADASGEVKITVADVASVGVADATPTPTPKWDEYTTTMQANLDEFTVQYKELEERAKNAQGDTKTALDLKVADAKVKLDAAAAGLDELKSRSPDQWDALKEGLAHTFDQLRSALA